MHFKNGKLQGLVTQWYETGKKKSTSYYKNGIENGLRNEDFEQIIKGVSLLVAPLNNFFEKVSEGAIFK